MNSILVLFALGLLFLSLEIILPGGIVGVIGGILMVAGTYMAFHDFGALGGAIAIVCACAAGAAAFYLEMVVIPRTRLGRSMILSAEVTGRATQAADASYTGRSCQAVTVLAPSGIVRIGDRQMEAFCRDGFVEAGTQLIIQGSDNFRLIVSKIS